MVNPAGLILAKAIPAGRVDAFAGPGLGASPSWHGFGSGHTGIAFSGAVGFVGDQRIRIDRSALRAIGSGLGWAPAGLFDRAGAPVPGCSRESLRRIETALAGAGLTALVGHEIEFVLVDADGGRLPEAPWAPYGLAGVLEHEHLVGDIVVAATAAGLGVEQCHAEYAANQFELSLTAQPPVAAADQLVLARIILGRVARRHGLRVSLSPMPFAGGPGTGAHQHVSLTRYGRPVFSGGTGAAGMTDDGEHAVAGLLRGLTEAQAVLCGSIVSGLRMRPGSWAGAYRCWGTENREAAVRFVPQDAARSATVEVKTVDGSANPYFASAAILGLMLHGIAERLVLEPETVVDPATLPAAGRPTLLSSTPAQAIAALDGSPLLRGILTDQAVDLIIAVRRMEQSYGCNLSPAELTEKFRMAWSV